LTNYEISEIFNKNNKNHIPLIKYIEELNLKTKYLYLSESKNYIYYACYKKISNCKGTGKVDKANKKFIITYFCDKKLDHLKIDYKEFINIMESNKYTELNSDDIYIQKLFVIYMINKKNIRDNPTINKYFTDYFGSNLSLSNSVLSKIKNKFFD